MNIATDLEHALLTALGRTERMTDAECSSLSRADREVAEAAVEQVVVDKIREFLGSEGRADRIASGS